MSLDRGEKSRIKELAALWEKYQMKPTKIVEKQIKKCLHLMKDDPFPSPDEIQKIVDGIPAAVKALNASINSKKKRMFELFPMNHEIRKLSEFHLKVTNVVSIFESFLTRTLQMQTGELSEDIIIVRAYYFPILKDIIENGFYLRDEKYICLTASAGQIRTKKTVFIRESLWEKHQNTLMCGLTLDKINASGGVNVNKYLAYLALCNSATDVWESFDIHKSIVVDDFETNVNGLVDFIDDKTYRIERRMMDVPITHTDGCGMMLPRVNNVNMMVRLPWVKGLLAVFPFDQFISEYCGEDVVVKDIYGKEHHILEEGIEVIFTKSQFKMWKYYESWEQYIKYYEQYNCQAGKCNEEGDFDYATLNYQMIQTLTDFTDEELTAVCAKTKDKLCRLSRDYQMMLNVFGVKPGKKLNPLQQMLSNDWRLLQDPYVANVIKSLRDSIESKSYAGEIDIKGVYTFLIPDLFAFCQFLFKNEKNPSGLLQNDEVFCDLFRKNAKLDCLRSPHLYREHAVRPNIAATERAAEYRKWFVTKGIYTSCHDLISKMLQFDNDGDKSLVCADETFVSVAERNMNGIVPLFYNMAKAGSQVITPSVIYNGLIAAYTGGNIGEISNKITKIWNSTEPDLEIIKLLCMENNFVIDYAKTLYKPVRPPELEQRFANYGKSKLPVFFIEAKGKTESQVEQINDSVVNRMRRIIGKNKFYFSTDLLGPFDHTTLMKNPKVRMNTRLAKSLIEDYSKYARTVKSYFYTGDAERNNYSFVYGQIRKEIVEKYKDIDFIVDVLVRYLFEKRNTKNKTVFFECFGDVALDHQISNLERVKGEAVCHMCGKTFAVYPSARQKELCPDCYTKHRKFYKANNEATRRRIGGQVIISAKA